MSPVTKQLFGCQRRTLPSTAFPRIPEIPRNNNRHKQHGHDITQRQLSCRWISLQLGQMLFHIILCHSTNKRFAECFQGNMGRCFETFQKCFHPPTRQRKTKNRTARSCCQTTVFFMIHFTFGLIVSHPLHTASLSCSMGNGLEGNANRKQPPPILLCNRFARRGKSIDDVFAFVVRTNAFYYLHHSFAFLLHKIIML